MKRQEIPIIVGASDAEARPVYVNDHQGQPHHLGWADPKRIVDSVIELVQSPNGRALIFGAESLAPDEHVDLKIIDGGTRGLIAKVQI